MLKQFRLYENVNCFLDITETKISKFVKFAEKKYELKRIKYDVKRIL